MREDRRAALRRIANAMFAAALATSAGRLALAAETARILDATPPRPDAGWAPSFDVFFALSQLVTCRSRLDHESAQKMYPLFMEEPWGRKHIATAYSDLVKMLATNRGKCSAPQLIALGTLPDGETWFCEHLLTTWYLGIYYHERGNVRVMYQDALMWDPVRDITNIPAVQGGSPGYWSKAPAAARRRRK